MGWRDDGLGRRLRAGRTATGVRALEDDAGSRVGEARVVIGEEAHEQEGW